MSASGSVRGLRLRCLGTRASGAVASDASTALAAVISAIKHTAVVLATPIIAALTCCCYVRTVAGVVAHC